MNELDSIVFFIDELAESLREASLPLSGHFDEVQSAFAVRLSATQKKREAHLQNFSFPEPPGCLALRLSTTSSQGHVSRCNDAMNRELRGHPS